MSKQLIKKLGLMPPNELGPKELASYFEEKVLGILPGHLAVGGPNSYVGRSVTGNLNSDSTIAIVGKGITFDSGGISIKPAYNMHHMKFDMLGAATALALKKPLKDCKYKVELYGCCAENTFHTNTCRPGDVITYDDGTKVEVINTDAEGRLVLADGILEARKSSPRLIITIATLTGAAKAALGSGATALFSNDDVLASSFLGASSCEELIWQLPIWDMHRKDIKGQKEVSDLKNQGTMAGASTAAAFLEHFVGETPWLHLDIAGSAYRDGIPTGAMYDSLVKFLMEVY